MTEKDIDQEYARTQWRRGTKLDLLIRDRVENLIDGIHEWAAAYEQIREDTLSDLVLGRLIAYGYTRDDPERIACIRPSLWIAASLRDDNSGATCINGNDFIDVRVIESALVEPQSSNPSKKVGRGPLILEAIDHHHGSKLSWFDEPPEVRFAAYFAYFRSTGIEPRNKRGFSKQNFQKFEKIYKEKSIT